VALNAAAGMVTFDLAQDPSNSSRSLLERLAQKLAVATETIDSGAARAKLDQWVAASNAV
jgi:anthranilate phosphoribosyltransferase